jgi:hypothetical protein
LSAALSSLRAKRPECPKPELLQAAQSDVLPAHLTQDINRHVRGCPTCQSLLADLEVVDNTPLDKGSQARIWNKIQTAIAVEEPDTKMRRAGAPRWSFRFLPALGVAILGLGVVGLLLVMRGRQQTPNQVAQNPPAVHLSTPAPSVLQLEKAPVVLPASAAIVWRGQEDAAAKQIKALKQAMAPYESGDYAEAARRLQGLRKQYPDMAQASFYLGISQLFLNQNEDAARSLKDAVNITGSPVADDAQWYLALANHRLGKDGLAWSTLDALCKAGGKDSARACAGTKELESRR